MSGRPEVLFPLFADPKTLPGVGPKVSKMLEALKILAPRDLLFALPHALTDRRPVETVQDVPLPGMVTVRARIGDHYAPSRKGRPYRVVAQDARATFQIVFFHARSDFVKRLLPTGQTRLISGRAEMFDGVVQITHPDYMLPPNESDDLPPFEPIYPLTAGITQRIMSRAIKSALERAPDLEEWIDPDLLRKEGWPTWREALEIVHAPNGIDAISPEAPARRRLAYDELFAHQLTLALVRTHRRAAPGRETTGDGHLRKRTMAKLPYLPTNAQARAIDEIAADMAAAQRMNRLLQGDVGAGKTLVALMALLVAVEDGGQGVMMAPTEILARQHFEALEPLVQNAGVSIDILTGRDTGERRKQKLARLANGQTHILLGTHAVFQEDVAFHDLRLAIIDEQHRFGVRQRLALGKKGDAVDLLVMTATPIPRSLSLAMYGDMDISILDEKPPGRKPVKTALLSLERLDEVVSHLRKAVEEGQQAYWVCPLVDESEVVDLAAAEVRFAHLRASLGDDVVGLVHGKMPPNEKDSVMSRFSSNEISVLVATTVIEVGVNVPNATIMVIERAEHFGLAQLHQLRGRVGRGAAASTCLMLYQPPLTEGGERRLTTLRETEDGFRIAEVDLEMRGAGDVVGTAQSGLPRFQVADLERQTALMAVAQRDVRHLLEVDPDLKNKRGQAARVLLWLMRRNEAVGLMAAG